VMGEHLNHILPYLRQGHVLAVEHSVE
jgi:hypothetical protein